MSVDRYLFLSSYALIEFNEVEYSSEFSGCREHGKSNSDYCPKCGNENEIIEKTASGYPYIHKILEEFDIDYDMFCHSNNDQDQSKVILLPNTGEFSFDDYENIELEILPNMPETSIKSFSGKYGDELDKIKSKTELIKSCTVKFGLVQYFN